MKSFWAFWCGMFTWMLADALWCAPDYYIHGDISRTAEIIWVSLPLVAVIITCALWGRAE